MKGIGLLVIAVVFAGFGVFMLISGEIAVGLLSVLLGAIGLVGVVLSRAQDRGDARAGGLHEPPRGPYLALVSAGIALFAALGVVFIVATPVRDYRGGFIDTPAGSRVLGIIVVAVCVLAAVVLIVRLARRSGHRGRQPVRLGRG